MAHVNPTNERPDVPYSDQGHGGVAAGSSECSSFIKSNIKFNESELDSRNGCCPANVERELHLFSLVSSWFEETFLRFHILVTSIC